MKPWFAPSERQWVTIGLFCLAVYMLGMADWQPSLWAIDTFKSVLQAIVITGLLNMVGAFHFAANKSDETKSENTGKAFDAIAHMGRRSDDTPAGTPTDPVNVKDVDA